MHASPCQADQSVTTVVTQIVNTSSWFAGDLGHNHDGGCCSTAAEDGPAGPSQPQDDDAVRVRHSALAASIRVPAALGGEQESARLLWPQGATLSMLWNQSTDISCLGKDWQAGMYCKFLWTCIRQKKANISAQRAAASRSARDIPLFPGDASAKKFAIPFRHGRAEVQCPTKVDAPEQIDRHQSCEEGLAGEYFSRTGKSSALPLTLQITQALCQTANRQAFCRATTACIWSCLGVPVVLPDAIRY